MLRPMLFIGVGGSGGKTLRTISESIKVQLQEIGFENSIPSAWQFLHIDTTVIQDGADYPAPFLEEHQYYSAARAGMMYKDVVNKVCSLGDLTVQREILGGWAQPIPELKINTSKSMDRAIGRLIVLADLSGTAKAIKNAINQMLAPTALPELQELVNFLPSAQIDIQPEVVIISSTVGASGSGMFQDISEILKSSSNQHWVKSPRILLYTPQVFESLPHANSYMAANYLGAMNEIVANILKVRSDKTEIAYQRSGILPDNDTSGGSLYYFLGSNTGQESHDMKSAQKYEMNVHFQETGKIIARALLEGTLSNWLERLSSVNQLAVAPSRNQDPESLREVALFWKNSQLANYVLEEISRSKNHMQVWHFFWKGMRTRPLIEAIPITDEMRRSIIKGWFLSLIFGLRKVEYTERGQVAQLWNSSIMPLRWSAFPIPLPSNSNESTDDKSLLAAVLKSISIAFCEFGAFDNTQALEPFEYLLFLGREVVAPNQVNSPRNSSGFGAGSSTSQNVHSDIIASWILNGEVPMSENSLNTILRSKLKTSENRKEALCETVDEIRAEHQAHWQTFESVTWSDMPETWELRDDIDLALRDIREFVGKLG
jgi:hypothetical protein